MRVKFLVRKRRTQLSKSLAMFVRRKQVVIRRGEQRRAEQSRAEQSRAEQSRAEQSRGEEERSA